MEHYYHTATFRPQVDYAIGIDRAVFSYDRVSFDIEYNEAAGLEIERLCRGLRAGLPFERLESEFGEFLDHANEIIETFDRYGFLTEGAPRDPTISITGAAFWREVEAVSRRAKAAQKPVFFEMLQGGQAPRGVLVRYALEYYHVVRAGPRIIAGMLPHVADAQTQALLTNFLTSELGHDRLLMRSLRAVGFDDQQVAKALPLPETFAIISGFQVFADQEPLTFKALAFLLEEASPEFHESFVAACEGVGLGEDFWGPIVHHANINDHGEHGAISAQLLDRVEVVGQEERLVVLKQLVSTIECLVALERAIIASPLSDRA